MTEEQIRTIIREELAYLIKSDRYTFNKPFIQLADGTRILMGTSSGTRIGTSITEKMSFYGGTPIVQRSGSAQDAAGVTVPVKVSDETVWGYATQDQAASLYTLANELRASLVALNLIKGSA